MMDYRKLNSHIVLLGVVIVVGLFAVMEGSDPNVVYKKFTHNEKYTYKIALKHKIV